VQAGARCADIDPQVVRIYVCCLFGLAAQWITCYCNVEQYLIVSHITCCAIVRVCYLLPIHGRLPTASTLSRTTMTTEEHTNGSAAAAAAAQHDEPNIADQHDENEDWKSGLAKPAADDRYRTEDVTQTKVSKRAAFKRSLRCRGRSALADGSLQIAMHATEC
jgi:hypothetical protein